SALTSAPRRRRKCAVVRRRRLPMRWVTWALEPPPLAPVTNAPNCPLAGENVNPPVDARLGDKPECIECAYHFEHRHNPSARANRHNKRTRHLNPSPPAEDQARTALAPQGCAAPRRRSPRRSSQDAAFRPVCAWRPPSLERAALLTAPPPA